MMTEFFFDNKKPMIPMYVSLNGKKGMVRVQGIVNTGSTFVCIPEEVAETLGYDLDNAEERVKISTPYGTLDVPLVTLDEVTVLGKTATRIKTAIIPIPEEARINCVIGLTFLRNFTLGIDYSTGTLTLD